MYILTTTYYLIIEYLLIVYLKIKRLFFLNPPEDWKNGEKGDVVIILGFGETWVFLEKISKHLFSKGYRIHFLPDYFYGFKSISRYTEILKEYVDSNKLKDIIIIAHSKGGLIAKKYLDSEKNSEIIKLLITICTPFQGTMFGHLRFLSLKELRSREVIKNISSVSTHNNKIINLYPKLDNHIIPNKNSLLLNGQNILVDIIGHTRILESDETLKIIDRAIES